jgi:hypothetical protein
VREKSGYRPRSIFADFEVSTRLLHFPGCPITVLEVSVPLPPIGQEGSWNGLAGYCHGRHSAALAHCSFVYACPRPAKSAILALQCLPIGHKVANTLRFSRVVDLTPTGFPSPRPARQRRQLSPTCLLIPDQSSRVPESSSLAESDVGGTACRVGSCIFHFPLQNFGKVTHGASRFGGFSYHFWASARSDHPVQHQSRCRTLLQKGTKRDVQGPLLNPLNPNRPSCQDCAEPGPKIAPHHPQNRPIRPISNHARFLNPPICAGSPR